MLFRPSASIISSQIAPLFGFLGVEALLVLSGFLIGKNIYARLVLEDERKLPNVLSFIKKMAWRFLPLYFLVLLLTLLVSLLYGHPTAEFWKYLVFIQNFSHPMPALFPESWSITIVFFGSASLVLMLYFISKSFGSFNKSKLFLGFTLSMIGIFVGCKYNYYLHHGDLSLLEWDQQLKAVVIYRLDSFYIGVLCAWLYFNRSSFWVAYRKVLLLMGILMMLLLFVGVGYFRWLIDSKPFFWEVIYLPLTSISIALFLPFLSCLNSQQTFFERIFSLLSAISYSLFLIHYSVLLQVFSQFCNLKEVSSSIFLLLCFVFFVVALSMSVILYRFCEKPLADICAKN